MLSDATVVLASARDADDEVYTMGEAARLKGVSYHTVSRAVRRGVLQAQRIGKMVFITKANQNRSRRENLQARQDRIERP